MAHENILKMRKELVKFRYIEKRANFGKNSAPSIVDAQLIFRKFLDVILPSNEARFEICTGAGFCHAASKVVMRGIGLKRGGDRGVSPP